MIQYREILRLHSQGVSQRGIAAACRCSRKTIRDLVERAVFCKLEVPTFARIFPQLGVGIFSSLTS